jgi:pyruvate/2-oxoglutarate dehydrogenase complex dihydrolipoamide acyltransferase (E2) component
MMSPLLPLMAYRLVQLAVERPKINSTIVGDQRYQYDQVNLGFTVQVGDILYLTVTQDAGSLGVADFIQRLGEVQRRAMGHKLKADETQGATIAFSSMSRWKVTRHMPILPPQTALMIAHAANNAEGRVVLGASYDHRVLSGFDVVRLLQDLAKPPQLD